MTRGPILILRDSDLVAANGVRSGTGTPADPYVISDWLIDLPTGGPAVVIRSTTKHIVVRDNVLHSGNTQPTVELRDNSGLVVLERNVITHRGTGVSIVGGRTVITDGTVRDTGSASAAAAGVNAKGALLFVGNTTFTNNFVAVTMQDSDADLLQNLVLGGTDGFLVRGGEARLVANEVQSRSRHLQADGARLDVVGGLLVRPQHGVWAKASEVTVDGLVIEAPTLYAASLDDSRSTFTNVQVLGGAQGLHARLGRLDVSQSTFESVVGVAVRYLDSTGTASTSSYWRNGGGVALDGRSLVSVQSNSMYSNGWGVGIAYSARASIPFLSGNTVNGVPLAGVYHWMAANVVFTGARDSGHGAGWAGSLSREGLLVLYDVQEASITGASLSHGTVGVHAVNSFNVVVDASVLLSNRCGVVFNGTVGFVKNTTIDIPVDPPLTCGVRVQGGFAGIVDNTILRVDLGVVVEGGARANVTGNLVTETAVGITVVGGAQGDVLVRGNTLVGNRVGLEAQAAARAEIHANVMRDNTVAGVRVQGGAAFTFRANTVVGNHRGIEDLTTCAAARWSSRVEGNTVANNTHTGMTLNGTVVLRNNAFVDNGDDGANVCGRVESRINVFARNGGDGLDIRGSADLDSDVMVEQEFGAGLRVTGTLFVVFRANISANLDGIVQREILPTPPPTPNPTIPTLPCVCTPNPDPLWVQRSIVAGNLRYAVSASPQTDVNATNNHWGTPNPPPFWVPQYGEYGNVVSPNVRFVPWYRDAAMTDRAPL